MDMVLALFLLQFVSGLCINLVSIENYVRNDTLTEKNRNSTGKLSYQELTDNDQPTRGRRIFKVFPVKTNQRWNKKFTIPPELQDMSQDVPVAIIVAAKTDLHNLKLKNESNVSHRTANDNTTESKTHDVINDSHIRSNPPYENNEAEKQIISNFRQSYVRNLENVFKKAPEHIDESNEELHESNDAKETRKNYYENEDEHSREHHIENQPEKEPEPEPVVTLGGEHFENEDVNHKLENGKERSFTSLANENLCNIDMKFLKLKCSTDEQHTFDIHKYLKILRHDPHKNNLNVFLIIKN